jgi:predicted house-cleaning noncanonical NTP pyrophosphatase (MazG superfamily)
MKIPYNKLVRDRIPEILDAEGKEYSIVKCEDDDILAYAKKKLLEEAMEFVENPCAEEAADIIEILKFMCSRIGVYEIQVEAAAISKYARKGGFGENYILEWVKE